MAYDLIGAVMRQGRATLAGHHIFFCKRGET